MEINVTKTQYTVIGGTSKDLDLGEKIKNTEAYTYLEVTTTQDGRDETDVRRKIAQEITIIQQLPIPKNTEKTKSRYIFDDFRKLLLMVQKYKS